MTSTFASILSDTNLGELLSRGASTPWIPATVRSLTDGDLTPVRFASLITNDDEDHLNDVANAAKKIRAQRFGNAIKLYAPLYVSNFCINGCRYCGFNALEDIIRTELSVDDALANAKILSAQGHRHILLVAGEGSIESSLDRLEKIAGTLKKHFASISIETQPFDVDGYKRLGNAGIDGVTLYQETYQPDFFAASHPSGPKVDFAKRIDAIESAGAAGMRTLNIGILLGLADWRLDALALYLHARYLQRRFWQSSIVISLPRLKNAPKDFQIPHPVSDEDFIRIVVSLRCALPDVGISISTRESEGFRNRLLPLGITQMSAGSRTEPGGYANPHNSGAQFDIEDTRSPDEVAQALRCAGFDPIFKDWESCLH